ncbi:hypothetical protein QUF76_08050 [Desulfobacterales bacterium HSG16]|nr:hypothetical protein [Desulfobacterales bacterium HSG16]
MYVSLMLFLVARISFRAVPKVLAVLANHLGIQKIPCTQTVINWVTRLSIARMQNPGFLSCPSIDKKGFSNGFFWIIDISIGLGSGKIFTVLAIDPKHHALNNGAPKLQNVHCVAVAVAESWTGESIAKFMQKVIAVTGRPIGYLKDGGRDLAKGVRLLGEQGFSSISIDDVSHIIANLFKHEYQQHTMFDKFISACGKASKHYKQTILACLAPPKVSTKARFMNLHRLVIWADKLLKHSQRGCTSKNSVLSKLRAGMNEIPKCKAFINRFLRDAKILLNCQKVLKTEGLNRDTFNQCKHLLEGIPQRSGIRKGFSNWLDQHLAIAENLELENIGLPSASDILESLFGIAKQHGTGNTKDANRIALRIPALCGELTRNDVQSVLEITVKCQREVEANLNALTKQRRAILPNPGSINDNLTDEIQNIELIPESKKREKITKIINISERCKKSIGPSLDSHESEEAPELYQFQRALTG